jgi:hypothetical protein
MTLDEIRKLVEAATPGDWGAGYSGLSICDVFVWDEGGEGQAIAQNVLKADARFIAAARTLLPALLEVAEKAKDIMTPSFDAEFNYDVLEIRLNQALAALAEIKLP